MNMNKKQQELPISPCVSNCCLDEEDICLGCFRHIDEITGWHSADTKQRLDILQKIEVRKVIKLKS